MGPEIERAISGLRHPLREALLLPATQSYAKSAAALGIAPEALKTLVRNAQEEVAQELLGENWRDDPGMRRVLALQIDQVAIHMQKRRRKTTRP